MQVLGVDPAIDIAQKANDAGIETIGHFFSLKLAKRDKKEVWFL